MSLWKRFFGSEHEKIMYAIKYNKVNLCRQLIKKNALIKDDKGIDLLICATLFS